VVTESVLDCTKAAGFSNRRMSLRSEDFGVTSDVEQREVEEAA